MSHSPLTLTIPPRLAGRRLDRALADAVDGLSRAQVRRLIDAGRVTVNGAAGKPSCAVHGGDRVVVAPFEDAGASDLTPEAIPLDIVHEDDALLIVNKPRGLVVHPAPGHPTGTLVHALLHHTRGALAPGGAPGRPGIVHRLDRDTSGLLAVAKTPAAHAALAPQFAAHTVRRAYLALVWGTFTEARGTIEAPIGRSLADRKRMAITGLQSRPALTRFEVVAAWPGASELRVRLATGRTHQVRVHCAYMGHGIIGDPVYGSAASRREVPWPDAVWAAVRAVPGQLLHAAVLGLAHPADGTWMQWEAPPPAGYARIRAALAELGPR